MSYILDAMKKSELERKRGSVPGLQTEHVFRGDREKKRAWWKYAFIIVIGINIGFVADWYYTEQQERTVVSQQENIIPQATVLDSTKVVDKDVASRNDVATNTIVRSEVEQNLVKNEVAGLPVKEGGPGKLSVSESKSSKPVQVSSTIIEEQDGNKVEQKPVQDYDEQVAQTKIKQAITELNMKSPEDPIALISKKRVETIKKKEPNAISNVREPTPVIAKIQPIIEHDPRTILRISQLPDAVQRALPDLTYSGHLFSSNPDRRKLVINGRSMSEGEWITNDLQLDEITIDGAIFAYKEYYYQIELLRNWSVN